MDKLLLTLTLVAFSSGVLCNVTLKLADGETAAVEPQLSNVVCKQKSVCSNGDVRDDYEIIKYMGAYKLHKNPYVSWNEAREICMQEGAQLAVINSNAEATMLAEWLVREKLNTVAWIGIHDMFELGHWVTLNGETLATAGYDQWFPGEPNNEGGLGHCGGLYSLNGIFVHQCNRARPYFCKMNLW